MLRAFFPAALSAFPNLATKTALLILAAAPTPRHARALSRDQIRDLLTSAGRICLRDNEVERLHQTFAVPQLHQPPAVEDAMGVAVRSIVATLMGTAAAIVELQAALAARFDNHPDAAILRRLPGLGVVLGGRVLGEFGDDPDRFLDAASRRRYAGTAPVTRASGMSRVVLLRRARNQRLADACRWWAFNSMQHSEVPWPTTVDDAPPATPTKPRCVASAANSSGNSTTASNTTSPIARTSPGPPPPATLHRPRPEPPAGQPPNHGAQRRGQGLPPGRRAASRSALDVAAKTRTITGAGRWRPTDDVAAGDNQAGER
ncbi:hypothetical protein GCM10009789_67130 [Kribbella sancticallisti]|uniref:Transposase IS116/IS110/IS902 C-terminal domain-containing protein n=1 Tax=Kribbella sancticallisti TaxID=460087 RepID=A0ABN2ECU2_9ACTN